MIFYRVSTWTGAVMNAAWMFFVLFYGALVLFLAVEPAPEHTELLSMGAGVVAGWIVGADLVWTINSVEGLIPSWRSRVIGFFLAVPAVAIFRWANVADPTGSPVIANVPMFLVPALIMWLVLLLAGLAVKS